VRPSAGRVVPRVLTGRVRRVQPHALTLAGPAGVLELALAFLLSTWCVTNPFLKSKLVDVLFYGTRAQRRGGGPGPLGAPLLEHPRAREHLMPALMHFYIGGSSLLVRRRGGADWAQRSSRRAPARSFTTSSVSRRTCQRKDIC
jgi:hypothetical protein